MTFDQFNATLSSTDPPDQISPYIKAMWFDAKGDWEKAHQLAQGIEDSNAYWIHAYLHRKEGDTGNADYWYRRAGKKRPPVSLEEEWVDIVKALL